MREQVLRTKTNSIEVQWGPRDRHCFNYRRQTGPWTLQVLAYLEKGECECLMHLVRGVYALR